MAEYRKNLYPFTEYNDYLGRPLYKLSRRYFSKSKLLALNIADLPGSIATSGLFYLTALIIGGGNPINETIFALIMHQTITPLLLYTIHKNNQRISKGNLEEKLK